MSPKSPSPAGLSPEDYESATSQLVRLRQRLPDDAVAALAREVVARLSRYLVVHDSAHPSAKDIERFCEALVDNDAGRGAAFISAVRADGVSAETVYLAYLAAAARMLGVWWETDRLTFTEVTVGVSRIYGIMKGFRHHFAPAWFRSHQRALFAVVPGEVHSLGVSMAADFFRKRDWDVSLKVGLEHQDIIDVVAGEPYALVGYSAATEQSLEALAKLVVATRVSSPASLIVIGGGVTVREPDITEIIGADLSVSEADAIDQVEAAFEATRLPDL